MAGISWGWKRLKGRCKHRLILVLSEQNLVFLAVPKTGTTAIEMALRPKADVIFAKQRKHTTALRFRTKIGPFLRNAYDMNPKPFAIMRDPIDQIASWYRYRQNVDEAYPERSTVGISFDEFVLAVIEEEPPVSLTSSHPTVENCWSRICLHMKRCSCCTRSCQSILARSLFSNKRTSLKMLTQLCRLTLRCFYALHVKMNSHYTTG